MLECESSSLALGGDLAELGQQREVEPTRKRVGHQPWLLEEILDEGTDTTRTGPTALKGREVFSVLA